MLFEVQMASSKNNFSDYGLEHCVVDFEGNWHSAWSDSIGDENYVEICYHASFIDIDTLEDLLNFQKKCKERIIVDDYDERYTPFTPRFSHCITIYNDWME